MKENCSLMPAGFVTIAVIAGFLCAGAFLSSARPVQAQASPAASATPQALVHVFNPIPVTPPKGWNPEQWATLRAKCQEFFDKAHAGIPMTRGDYETSQVCHDMLPWPPSVKGLPSRQPKSPPVKVPTPIPTPDPISSLSDPLGATPIGPYGTPIYPDNLMDACLNLPGDGQPPDVAADVSPEQIVEMLNSGVWISSKSGIPYAGYPESLRTFWQANSPPVADLLADTQVAWDPIAQRWLATTLDISSGINNGDLYFAFSKTSDATQGWNVYKLANICSNSQNGNFPVPDQPVIGFNQISGVPSESWAAVDLQCVGVNGSVPARTKSC